MVELSADSDQAPRHLIWVFTLCHLPFKGSLNYNGLRGRNTLSGETTMSKWFCLSSELGST